MEGENDGDFSAPSFDSAANDSSRLRQGLARMSSGALSLLLSPRRLRGVLGDENSDRGVLCAEEGLDHAAVEPGEKSDDEASCSSSADFSGEEIRENISMPCDAVYLT